MQLDDTSPGTNGLGSHGIGPAESAVEMIYELTVEGLRVHRDGLDSIGRILESFRPPVGRAGL